jgi:DNA-binding response OmpR family regulator
MATIQPHGTSKAPVILIVEDNVPFATVLQHALELKGYRVLVAPDGNTAWRYVQEKDQPIDVLVTDVMLPGINGLDLIPMVQGRSPATRIIVCSGHLSRGELANSGADFLQKPFTVEQLLDTLERIGSAGERRTANMDNPQGPNRARSDSSGSSNPAKTLGSILVVDDEPYISTLLRDFLVREGYVVRFAATGGEALAWLQKNRPDVVILDLSMPAVNGVEMLRRLKTRYPTGFPFVVIVLTGTTEEPLVKDVQSLGVTEILHKPPDLLHLHAAIQAQLHRPSR